MINIDKVRITFTSFVVYMHWFVTDRDDIIVVANTKEDAQRYIDKQMDGRKYNGTGVYRIKEVELVGSD